MNQFEGVFYMREFFHILVIKSPIGRFAMSYSNGAQNQTKDHVYKSNDEYVKNVFRQDDAVKGKTMRSRVTEIFAKMINQIESHHA